MTLKHVTVSRAGHVTFPRVFHRAMGHSILSLHYILLIILISKVRIGEKTMEAN